jgi:YidC/Oxa1 family membrane protein insertase
MKSARTGRAFGFALAFLVMSLALSGCYSPPKPKEAAEALKTAQKLEKSGNLQGAMEQYSHAAHFDSNGPTAPEAYVKWGKLALKLHHPDQAVQAFSALRTRKENVTVETMDGPVHLPDDAEDLYVNAMKAEDVVKSTRLTYRFMDALVALTGHHPDFSYFFAIVIFTVVIKVVLTPLTIKQLRSSRMMMLIQPKMKEIQDKYRDRPEELNRRMLALYKEEGVNPFGCGSTMVLQMIIIFSLYRVILDYQYQFTKGHFLWVGSSLSHLYPHIFGANLARPDWPLLVIYSISMMVQQKLTMVPSVDSSQAQQQQMMTFMMPLMMLFVLRLYPSAFALYWLLYNVMSTVQQLHINKQLDEEMAQRKKERGTDDEGGAPAPLPAKNPINRGPSSNARRRATRRR